MAKLSLCDLCNGKVKRDFIEVSIRGRVQLYDGEPPPPPPGFSYREESNKSKLVKIWDEFGRYQGTIQYCDKPQKDKRIQVGYELCEGCGQKLMGLLETLRRKYHLEQKEIELMEHKPVNPFSVLGYDETEEEEDE